MTAIPASADLFGPIPDIADDVLAGLDLMMRSPPLWQVDRGTFWTDLVARATAFAERWDAPCRGCGWTPLELYGAHHRAPAARISCLGAAFLLARSGHTVLEVDSRFITVVTRAGSRLRIYRPHPDPDAVLAWLLCRPA